MSEYLGFKPTEEDRYFFVSYNSEDKDQLQSILIELSKSLPLWYDYGLTYNDRWSKQIADKIESSEAVILFFTKQILNKGTNSFVYKEYEMARSFFNKTIYVVFVDDIAKAEIPNSLLNWWIELIQYQCLFRSKYDSNASMVAALVAAVNYSRMKNVTLTDKDGNRYPITQRISFVGRERRKCSIIISESEQMVSGVHCCILYQNGQLFIQDLGTLNGTFINSHLIPSGVQHELHLGDVISLGNYELTVTGAEN